MNAPVITIDGPSGVGKGTLSVLLAKRLNWHFLDSGAIYRVTALAAQNKQLDLTQEDRIASLAETVDLSFDVQMNETKILLENSDVTAAIRTEKIGGMAAKIAVFPSVRRALLSRQHAFRQPPGLVADGRDMGTVVFPDACVKLFLDASADARAQRRVKQLRDKGICVNLEEVLSEIKERDTRDRNRVVAPLKPATDAFIIDSTQLTIRQVFDVASEYISKKIRVNGQ